MSGFLKKAAAKLAAWKKRVAIVALGYTFNFTFDWIFNYPLYGYVIERWGLKNGYFIMATLSFLTCLAFIRFYDWAKVDWLGIEVAKEVQDFGPMWIKNINVESKIGRILWWPVSKIILLILWAVSKGGLIAFFALSVFTDPFITTVYMRKGWGEFNGLSRRDWLIFLASTIVGNAYWSIRTFALLNFLGVYGYVIFLLLLIILITVSSLIKKWRDKRSK